MRDITTNEPPAYGIELENESHQTQEDNCDAYLSMRGPDGELIGGGHGYDRPPICETKPCKTGHIFINDIMKNVNCLLAYIRKITGCCDEWKKEYTEIRGKMFGDILYLTSDHSIPVQVPIPRPIPKTHTFMNHEEMENIFWNHKNVLGMFMDGVLVFYKPIHLELPQFTNTFNLKDWIIKELTKMGQLNKAKYLIVHNGHTQPTMHTGDLSQWSTVELHNDGEFQGTNPCETALYAESKIYLYNNGWIRGAGGNGVAGRPGSKGADGKTIPGIPGKVVGHKNVLYGSVTDQGVVKGAGCPAGWCVGAVDYFEIEAQMTTGGTVYRARHDVGWRWQKGSIWEGHGPWGPWQVSAQAAHGSIPPYGGPNEVWSGGIHYTAGPVIYREGTNFPAGNRLASQVRSVHTQHYRSVPIYSGGKPAIPGGKGGHAGTAGTAGVGQSFKTKQTNGGHGGKGGNPGPTPSGGHPGSPGTDGTNGTNGGIWGVDGAGCKAGYAIRGSGNIVNYKQDGPGKHAGKVS